LSVVAHIPHSSTLIPPELRDQFCVSDEELAEELERLTDHSTDLMAPSHLHQVCFPYSRLLVDVERFWDESMESMSSIGMGAVYRSGSELQTIRRDLRPEELQVLKGLYDQHHSRLERAVDRALEASGHCLLIDLHSYPKDRLSYEQGKEERPELCLGTDPFHTPEELVATVERLAAAAGFETLRNSPFSGTLVPLKHYRKEPRVQSIMLEWRRDLYHGRPDQEFQIAKIRRFIGGVSELPMQTN
jgi:N-formylglutamate amidohydrolase